MTDRDLKPSPAAVAVQVAEHVTRAQDMLARLGARSAYEPNYAIEKLADAARCSLEACVLLGMSEREVDRLVDRALQRGIRLRGCHGACDRRV